MMLPTAPLSSNTDTSSSPPSSDESGLLDLHVARESFFIENQQQLHNTNNSDRPFTVYLDENQLSSLQLADELDADDEGSHVASSARLHKSTSSIYSDKHDTNLIQPHSLANPDRYFDNLLIDSGAESIITNDEEFVDSTLRTNDSRMYSAINAESSKNFSDFFTADSFQQTQLDAGKNNSNSMVLLNNSMNNSNRSISNQNTENHLKVHINSSDFERQNAALDSTPRVELRRGSESSLKFIQPNRLRLSMESQISYNSSLLSEQLKNPGFPDDNNDNTKHSIHTPTQGHILDKPKIHGSTGTLATSILYHYMHHENNSDENSVSTTSTGKLNKIISHNKSSISNSNMHESSSDNNLTSNYQTPRQLSIGPEMLLPNTLLSSSLYITNPSNRSSSSSSERHPIRRPIRSITSPTGPLTSDYEEDAGAMASSSLNYTTTIDDAVEMLKLEIESPTKVTPEALTRHSSNFVLRHYNIEKRVPSDSSENSNTSNHTNRSYHSQSLLTNILRPAPQDEKINNSISNKSSTKEAVTIPALRNITSRNKWSTASSVTPITTNSSFHNFNSTLIRRERTNDSNRSYKLGRYPHIFNSSSNSNGIINFSDYIDANESVYENDNENEEGNESENIRRTVSPYGSVIYQQIAQHENYITQQERELERRERELRIREQELAQQERAIALYEHELTLHTLTLNGENPNTSYEYPLAITNDNNNDDDNSDNEANELIPSAAIRTPVISTPLPAQTNNTLSAKTVNTSIFTGADIDIAVDAINNHRHTIFNDETTNDEKRKSKRSSKRKSKRKSRTNIPVNLNNELNSAMFAVGDHDDLERDGMRIQHIESNSLTSFDSHPNLFFDIYSIKRLFFLILICLVIPPIFFIIGIGKKGGITDYRLMKMIMNEEHRIGLFQGFIWDVDINWLRKLCLVMGMIETIVILGCIGIGFGVGLTR
ncbi:hypothetical protein TBLA_0A08410 [Henningerozyma blattae CBS 6284]|uniref:Uncharacterized protein n=1 Tax=Henningerozyma blattae (strain ATCC 34711 / CBS 6284 / DSM 70876 / NBRC 10599 / NRRL Y-10934 / UCD 77-7) TaxID=1071380 RepID=I2GWX8_HENB6|nr:hypothetical protein TBLA_0A08410 [Tetrapisispora blattae CBS 6284]CCH58630.1 hypothetical protein TBLA_0A08410 [Tetrapisispora blattae CBS 6284]